MGPCGPAWARACNTCAHLGQPGLNGPTPSQDITTTPRAPPTQYRPEAGGNGRQPPPTPRPRISQPQARLWRTANTERERTRDRIHRRKKLSATRNSDADGETTPRSDTQPQTQRTPHTGDQSRKTETPTTVRRSPRPGRQTPTKPKPGHQTVQPNPRPQQPPQPPTLAPPPPQRPGATNRDPQCFPTRRPGPCRHSQHARTACSPGPKHSTALPPSCTTTDLGTSKARKQSEAAPQKATNTQAKHRRSPQTRNPNGPHGRGHPVDGRTRTPDHPTPGNPNTSTTSAGHPPGP